MDFIPSDELEQLLNSPLGVDTASTLAAAAAVAKLNYDRLHSFRNVTSYSTQQVLFQCPRKFQWMKMRAAHRAEHGALDGDPESRGSVTFAFGHAVGAGVAVYDKTKNLDAAIFAAFLAWDVDLLAEIPRVSGRPHKKESFAYAVWALEQYPRFYEEDTDINEYEVVKLEASVAVDLENGYFYTGHVDELLRHRETGKLRVKENKTSGFAAIDPALYSNSEQALSYSVVVGAHGVQEYDVLYTIYSKPNETWLAMPFVKTKLARVEWMQSQGMTSSELDMYSEHNFFPMRGGSCLAFNRRCELYEECNLSPELALSRKFSELPVCRSFEDIEAVEYIDYRVTWSQLVSSLKEQHG